MPKRKNNIYLLNCTYEKLYEAYTICKKSKTNRLDVILFSMDVEKNLKEILSELLNCNYTFSSYNLFYVYEPKKRKILAATFRDRIVHTWYVNSFILPYFVPSFINTSYACIKGRGMHMAAKAVQKGLRTCNNIFSNPYVLKMDITKFFENINRNKVYELVKRKIRDEKVLKLTMDILNSSSCYDEVSGISLPIGNYTSQMFANIYLNELDRFIKDKLHVKWYYRYMDDMVLILKDKECAKERLSLIKNFLSDETIALNLSLNSKTQIFKICQGVNFCGYKINVKRMRIRNKGKKKLVAKLKWIEYNFSCGNISVAEAKRCFVGHLGYIKHADISGIVKKYLS
ncbi:MAG: group II intron reverse transcriptase domain-containing protein [Clostridia bacterium]|nr:group II intron reverse transcriptase domain-containing protein [Clostridia bacterium]